MIATAQTCHGCGTTDDRVQPVQLCPACLGAADARLAEVKLRLSGAVDWDDIKKYGLYDRFGVPVATVQSVSPRQSQSMLTTSTGPIAPRRPANMTESMVDIVVTPLRRSSGAT